MTFEIKMNSSLFSSIDRLASIQDHIRPVMVSVEALRKVVDPVISAMRPFIQLRDVIINNPEINYLSISFIKELDIIEIESIEKRLNDNLIPLLTSNNLINLWIGADFAMNTPVEENPDKLRHFLISIRTIFEQSIDKLAPEKLVKKHKVWTDFEKKLSDEGKKVPFMVPRELKIKYFSEKFQFKFFEDFAKDETIIINGLYDKLCKVHSPNIKIQEKDLRFIRLNAGLTIWLFLFIDNFIKNKE